MWGVVDLSPSISCYGTLISHLSFLSFPAFLFTSLVYVCYARPKLVCDKNVSLYIRFARLAPRFSVLL